jgi:hypothetical protein
LNGNINPVTNLTELVMSLMAIDSSSVTRVRLMMSLTEVDQATLGDLVDSQCLK